MRFYPRQAQSRTAALTTKGHVSHHPADELTERDRNARYSNGRGAVVTCAVTFNESDVVNAGVKATGTLTLTPGEIADDVVRIGAVYYQFAADPTTGTPTGLVDAPYLVAVGASDTIALANLRKAINATGVAGTDYCEEITAAHATVEATASDGTTLSARALSTGTAGNSISTTVTGNDGLAWGAVTLTGGYSSVVIPLVVSGDDKFQADAVSARSALLIAAFPETDDLRAALGAEDFAISADHKTITLTLPAIAGYTISGDATYDVTLDKTLFLNANAAVVVVDALTVTNGA